MKYPMKTLMATVLFTVVGCNGDGIDPSSVQITSYDDDKALNLLSKIAPEDLLVDIYLNDRRIVEKESFSRSDEQFVEVDIPLESLDLLDSGLVNNTIPYDIQVDYFILNTEGNDFLVATSVIENRRFGNGASRINPNEAQFTYHDQNSNDILDIFEFSASVNPSETLTTIQIPFADESTRSLDIVEVDVSLNNLILASQNQTIRYLVAQDEIFRGIPDFSANTWYAFTADREHSENICFGGPSAPLSISALQNTLSRDILLFGVRNGFNYIFSLKAGSIIDDLADISIQDNENGAELLDNSILMYLVPANTVGHLQAYVNNSFDGQSCVFSLTSPPILE